MSRRKELRLERVAVRNNFARESAAHTWVAVQVISRSLREPPKSVQVNRGSLLTIEVPARILVE
jgi:hypothetical protein